MKEGPIEADITLKTEADFEAWKQAMKGNNAKDEEDMIAAESSLAAGLARKPTQPTTEPSSANDLTFNLWSEPKREERETSVSTPKTTSKPKSSRFAGFFGPTAPEPQQQQMQEPARAPSPTPPPHVPAPISSQAAPLDFGGNRPRDEDQEGFQKVMQMLRLGNGSAQNTGILPFGGPPPASQAVPTQETSSRRQTSVDGVQPQQQQQQPQPQRQHVVTSAKPHPTQQPLSKQSTQTTQSTNPQIPSKQILQPTHPDPQRPAPPVNRDSEFLLKLMQQPRVPFAEGQIYGQGYNSRKDPAEIASLLGNLNVGQRGQVLGPPPGMQLDDRGGYTQYQQMQSRSKQPPQMHMDDRATGMQGRPMPPQDEQRFQPQPPPGFDPRQHLSRPMMPDGVSPPPGFASQGRGPPPPQMPPGFYQSRGMMPGQPGPPGYYPQAMPPNAGMPGLPPGFMQGPPPGMPQSQQRRRHPSMGSMQPGFDVNGGIDVYPGNHQPRGVQQPQQYQQYMK